MAKRRRKRKANLGSPPSAHVKRVKRLMHDVIHYSEQAETAARAGKCDLAATHYENSVYRLGELHAHMGSIGKHEQLVRSKMRTNMPLRAQIAARKALEAHCGREPAIRR
jgi:hypothetical protein